MKNAADFRSIARDVLRGKWAIAVIVGLVATLLGGGGKGGPEIKFNIDVSSATASFEFAGQTIFSTRGGLDSGISSFLVGSSIYIGLAILVIAVVYLILGSVIELGYSRFILELVDRREKKSFVCFSSTICSTIFPIAMTPFI